MSVERGLGALATALLAFIRMWSVINTDRLSKAKGRSGSATQEECVLRSVATRRPPAAESRWRLARL